MKIEKLSDVDILKFKEAYRKVLYWFFSYPNRQIGLNDLSEELETAKKTARLIVLQLIEEDFLKKEEIGKAWRISCNKNHYYNKTIKISYNLELIFLSDIIKRVYETVKGINSIILFGSYRWGDDDEKSDIDIAVETLNNKPLKIVEIGIIKEFGYRKDVPVNIHIFSRNKIDLNLFANISNGIVLDGFLEVHP